MVTQESDMKRSLLPQLLLAVLLSVFGQFAAAQPGQGYQCPSCQVEYPTEQDLAEIISDLLEISPGMVLVVRGDDPGVFIITLPDDSSFVVAPVGPTFRYQNTVQRRVQQTEEGGLRLRSQSRAELHIRSAVHREPDVVAELLRLGWTNFYWFRHGWEVDSPSGARYCFEPDIQVGNESAPGSIQISLDDDGNLVVVHTDGIRQRLHACAHDFFQLRDRIRQQVQQQLMLDPDGSFGLMVDSQQLRFRLNAELRWSGVLDQPGFYTEGNRILLRYRDGWEQEVVQLD